MTKQERKKAEKMLSPYADRVEHNMTEKPKSYGLTVYWRGGGQKLFWVYEEVLARVEEINQRSKLNG